VILPGTQITLNPALYDVQIRHCAFAQWQAQPTTTLSLAEQQRAARFIFAHDQHAYTCTHQFVRETLAVHTHIPAALLEFAYTAEQKPLLPAAPQVHFNLSHTKQHAVIATSHTYALGVDIEQMHTVSDALALAQAHFTAAELTELQHAPTGPARDRVFLQGWTRKEACLKAAGSGLTLPARSVHTGLAPERQQVSLQWAGYTYVLELQSFVHQDLIGAVAVVIALS
jgi:4'-phosphopantetheinyl transferase